MKKILITLGLVFGLTACSLITDTAEAGTTAGAVLYCKPLAVLVLLHTI